MKKMTTVATAGLAAVSLSFALVGCGSDSKTETKTSTSTSTSTSAATSTSTSTEAAPTPSQAAGTNKTIADYLKENNIQEVAPIKPGTPGSPTIELPKLQGWSDAAGQTPPDATGALIFDTPDDPASPPSIIWVVSKLTGNADPKKILELAPGELQNLPSWEPLGPPNNSTLSGFDAIQFGGNFTKDGKKRIIAQKTAVIPGKDGSLYVLQMNAVALDGQERPLMDATSEIDKSAKITP
jgi:hypothetical protein